MFIMPKKKTGFWYIIIEEICPGTHFPQRTWWPNRSPQTCCTQPNPRPQLLVSKRSPAAQQLWCDGVIHSNWGKTMQPLLFVVRWTQQNFTKRQLISILSIIIHGWDSNETNLKILNMYFCFAQPKLLWLEHPQTIWPSSHVLATRDDACSGPGIWLWICRTAKVLVLGGVFVTSHP